MSFPLCPSPFLLPSSDLRAQKDARTRKPRGEHAGKTGKRGVSVYHRPFPLDFLLHFKEKSIPPRLNHLIRFCQGPLNPICNPCSCCWLNIIYGVKQLHPFPHPTVRHRDLSPSEARVLSLQEKK